MVGDHTNLLGMGAKLNPLAKKAGISFNYDAISPRVNPGFNNYKPTWFPVHSAATGVENLLFMTSCSLKVDPSVRSVLTVSDCVHDPHDYANSSYFGNRRVYPETEYGPAILCAMNDCGSGKIAAFTDSTVWSSFAFHKFGRSRLFLNLITQLNRKSSPWIQCFYWGQIGIAFNLILGFTVHWNERFGWMLSFCLIGILGGQFSAAKFNENVFRNPTAKGENPSVVFLWEGGQCAVPETLGDSSQLDAKDMFDTFYVSTQRLGIVPRVARKYSEVFSKDCDCLVMIRPVWVPEPAFIKKVGEFVRGGGKLVLMEDLGTKRNPAIDAMLSEVGIKYDLFQGNNSLTSVTINGNSIQTSDSGMVHLGFQKIEKGGIVYIPSATRFSRKGMGHCFTIPPDNSKIVYETVETVFRDLLKVGLPDIRRKTYGILEKEQVGDE